VTKFAKASIFSVFNNLKDLTLNRDYAGVCGFTLSEFETYFNDYLPEIIKDNVSEGIFEATISIPDFKQMILDYYDGYSWDGKTKILNPYSLINFLDVQRLEPFWYGSATPTFLLNLIKKNPYEISQLINQTMTDNMLDAVDVDKLKLLPLLFQTEYLTIEKLTGATSYLLKEPNLEVANAFNIHILEILTEQEELSIRELTSYIKKAFETLDASKLAKGFRQILQWIPWQIHVPLEHYYHSIIYAVLKSFNFKVSSEVSEAEGIFDLLVTMPGNRAFVAEFKYEKFKDGKEQDVYMEALKTEADEVKNLLTKALTRAKNQIEDKNYAERYINEYKEAHKVLVGVVGRTEVTMEIY
jgi:hypothetical protein